MTNKKGKACTVVRKPVKNDRKESGLELDERIEEKIWIGKKNDVFQVQIEDMSDTGEGIGKTDGFTWFVKDAVIGDVVEAKVMKQKNHMVLPV